MKKQSLENAFATYLSAQGLRFTSQRKRVFDRAFATHEHFTAERLYNWLAEARGAKVSRATVYRTLALLVEGGFLNSLDTGKGELLYEHVLGHKHHDHMVCVSCGRIDEFHSSEIERLQEAVANERGFVMVEHDLRLFGYCRACVKKGLCPLVESPDAEPAPQDNRDLGQPRRVGLRVPGRGKGEGDRG
ncbi:MAG: Fur family transcriptional regulator [Planctomycetota bacterium]